MAFIVMYSIDSKESLVHAKEMIKLIEMLKTME